MKTIDFYLDFISPYAFMAFHALPETLADLYAEVHCKPVLFAGMLKHHGQLGPAEIDAKRDWTYRQVLWLARQHAIELELPQAHPFNPLALLRLSLACEAQSPTSGIVSREVCGRIFRHVWQGGAVADDPVRLALLAAELMPVHSPDAPEVKAALKANTDQAIARGVFGVPTFLVEGRAFWGFDSLPMLRACLQGDLFFDDGWHRAGAVSPGVRR